MKNYVLVFLILMSTLKGFSQENDTDRFLPIIHHHNDLDLPYRLFIPDSLDETKEYPIVLILHGGPVRGNDNLTHIQWPQVLDWVQPAIQDKWPSYIVAPQCPDNRSFNSQDIMASINDMMDTLVFHHHIDTDRIYITGYSFGGTGTWGIIQAYPDRYAAAVPMCGASYSTYISNILNLPIWCFHGADDNTIDVEYSRSMILAFSYARRFCVFTHCSFNECNVMTDSVLYQKIQDGATFLYTEFPNTGHAIRGDVHAQPYFFEWVFLQSKSKVTKIESKMTILDNFQLHQNFPNPFNPSTTILFILQKQGHVTLKIYNLTGQEIATLVDEVRSVGNYQVLWQAEGIPSGIYFARLQASTQTKTMKLVLQK